MKFDALNNNQESPSELSEDIALDKHLRSIHEKSINTQNFDLIIDEVAEMLFSKIIKFRIFAESFIEHVLFKHGVPYKVFMKAWKSNAGSGSFKDGKIEHEVTPEESNQDFKKLVKKNLIVMKEIEIIHPGICKYLYENFGIRNFGRFSKETWVKQYENREDQGNYGLVIAANHDWNSSFYSDESFKAYEDLRRNVEKGYHLRIIEAESLLELARQFSFLKRKYINNPAFAVWAGHYSKGEFFFGEMKYRKHNYKYYLSADDINAKDGKRIAKYLDLFSSNTIMIVDACGDGMSEDSLTKIGLNKIGNTLIHPDGKTSVEDFGANVGEDGLIKFDVKYAFDTKTIQR